MKRTIAVSAAVILALLLSTVFVTSASELLIIDSVTLVADEGYRENTPEDVFRIVNESAMKEMESGKLVPPTPVRTEGAVQNNAGTPAVSVGTPVYEGSLLREFLFGR